MRLLCLRHRALTLFSACRDCLRERAVRSLTEGRAEVATLRATAERLRQERVTKEQPTN